MILMHFSISPLRLAALVALSLCVSINCELVQAIPVNSTLNEPIANRAQLAGGIPSASANGKQDSIITKEFIQVQTKQSHVSPQNRSVEQNAARFENQWPMVSASLQQATNARVDLTFRQNTSDIQADKGIRDIERMVEGSGLGPPGMGKSQKQKLDDTDDSDDDADDEDYDDKEPLESGSGHSQPPVTTRKPDSIHAHSDTIQKPATNDFYNPFRPPTTNGVSIGSIHNSPKSERLPGPTSPIQAQFIPFRTPAMTTISTTTTTTYTTTTAKPSLSTSYVTIAPSARVPIVSNQKQNKTEADYDYEDESDDDESEEPSMFEDNEPSDGDIAVNKTSITPLAAPNTNRLNTTKLDLPTRLNSSATTPSWSSFRPPVPTPRLDTIRPKEQPPSFRPALEPEGTVTSKPLDKSTNLQGISASYDGVDEDEEEEDEDDEEEEEEIDDGVEDDSQAADSEELPVNKSKDIAGPFENSLKKPSGQNRPNKSGGPPVMTSHPDTRLQGTSPATLISSQKKPSMSEHIATVPPSDLVAKLRVPEPTSAVPTQAFVPGTFVPATSAPSKPLLVSFLPTTTIPPPMKTSGVGDIASPPPPPQGPSLPISPVVPAYFPTTPSPDRSPPSTSHPTGRITPSITTSMLPYDKFATPTTVYSDDSLTRQIYDKAVEAYHEADKTIRSALEAVWPPNINLDHSTLEPLMAQPIFFMLALGGAIIGLVLLMMLVVYMITYQIQPKDDDISIY